MSTRSKKKTPGRRQKKEEKPKRSVVKVLRPSGIAPFAFVNVRHAGSMMQRRAKGYSPSEIEQAGIGTGLARRWGLSIDDRRRSALEGNVSSLKKWTSQVKRTTVEARAEGEMRAIEKAVEREVHKAEREVVEVGKEVVEKVEAPVKKRTRKKSEPKSKAD